MPRRVATREKTRAGRPERLRDRRLERPRGSRQRPKRPLPLRRGDAGRASAPPLIIESVRPLPPAPSLKGRGCLVGHLRPASLIAPAYPRPPRHPVRPLIQCSPRQSALMVFAPPIQCSSIRSVGRTLIQGLAQLPLVVAVVFVGDQVGLHHHGDVGGVELLVDHRAVADEAAQPQVAFDQRRQSAPARAADRSRRAAAGASPRSGAAGRAGAAPAGRGGCGRGRSARPPERPDRCPAGWRSRTSGRSGSGTHRRRCRATAAAWRRGCGRRHRRRSGRVPGCARESSRIGRMSYSPSE